MKAEEQPAAEPVEKQESADVDDVDSEEVTQLSTGETITLREARSFMDYYCKRFGFGEPKISYETVAMRAGPQKWEAIMEVSVSGKRDQLVPSLNRLGHCRLEAKRLGWALERPRRWRLGYAFWMLRATSSLATRSCGKSIRYMSRRRATRLAERESSGGGCTADWHV